MKDDCVTGSPWSEGRSKILTRPKTFLLVLLTILGLTTPGFGGEELCTGLPVARVLFEGCGETPCSQEKIQAALVSLTDLVGPEDEAGDPVFRLLGEQDLARAVDRLMKSGHFLSVAAACRVEDGAGVVRFQVVPNTFISDVSIVGTRHFYKVDLEKRLFVRKGSVFNPKEKEYREKMSRQEDVLVNYLRKQGYDKATVKGEIYPEQGGLIRMKFRVDEGEVARVSNVRIKVTQSPEPDDPEYGCPEISSKLLSRVADVPSGVPYTQALGRKTKKDLQLFLQQYGFIAPAVKLKYDAGRRTLECQVKLGQCASIVFMERETGTSEEGIRGYRTVNEPELYEILPFRESGVFDRTEAELGIEEVLIYYHTRGYLFTRVDLQYFDFRQANPGWNNPKVGSLRYLVTVGEPTEIRKLDLEGASLIPQDELKEQMATVPYDFFGEGGFLQVEQLMGDLGKVKDYYRSKGFFRMRFKDATDDPELHVGVRREGDSTILLYTFQDRAFEVIKNDWENPIYIRVRIDEGEPSRVASLAIEGMEHLPPEQSTLDWELQEGGFYSNSLVQSAIQSLRWQYEALGYHRATITATCQGEDPTLSEDACDPTRVNSRRVHVTLHVVEQDQAQVGELFWHGLGRTRSSVIERDFPKPGEPFDRQKLAEAVRRIRDLGVFASVRTTYIGMDEDPPRERIAVVVHVEEASNKFLDLSAGFQTMTREADEREMDSLISDILSGSIHYIGSMTTGRGAFSSIHFPDLLMMTNVAYTDRNFLGLAKELTIPVSYGLSTTDLVRYASFMPTYRDRRFLGTNVTLRLTPLIEYDKALRDIDSYKYGMETELSQRFFKHIYLSLRNEVSRIAWKKISDDQFSPMDIQLEASPHIRFDYRNSPTNPTDGTYVGLRVSYINAINESGERDNFLKMDLAAHWYISFRKTLVLATFLRMGTSYSTQGDHLPANHAFRLGGTSGMRGYPAGGIAQYDREGLPLTEMAVQGDGTNEYSLMTDGDALVNGTVEFRFPIFKKKEVWGTAFLDYGALSNSLASMNGNSFRFSVGTGVRWLLGGQIPLRLDYGVIMDRRCSTVDPATGDLSECRKESYGALDFGLLYTF